MKLRLELHDSEISGVVHAADLTEIKFSTMVILNVTDEFGYEFNSTTYKPGRILLKNAKFDGSPEKGEVFDGHIRVGEAQFSLIPLEKTFHAPCALFLSQNSGSVMIFADEIRVELD